MPSPTWLQTNVVSKRIGQIIAPIYDAPYTVPALESTAWTEGGSNPGPRIFAPGSPWPLLNFCRWNTTPSIPLLERFNGAILRPLAATYFIAGNQGTLTTPTMNDNNPGPVTAPCYFGGFIGYGYQYSAAKFNYLTQPVILGVGSTNFPGFINFTSSDFNGGLSGQIRSETSVIRSGNSWAFAILDTNGAGSQAKVFTWAPNGSNVIVQDINGPYLPASGGFLSTNASAMMPFKPIGTNLGPNDPATVVLCSNSGTPNFRFVLMFFDSNFNCVGITALQLDDPNYDTILNSQHSSPALRFVKVTQQGFLISVAGGANQRNDFIISPDGAYWAPITINLVGPQAQAWSASVSGITYQNSDIHIDPNGTFWFAGNPASTLLDTYIGNTFGYNINFPPQVAATPSLPPFQLPCFTPCDIPISP